jgi:hypothetical protein
MVDKYKKGRRIYTHWDKKSEQVTVPSRKKGPVVQDAVKTLQVEVPAVLASGKRADFFLIHSNKEEFVIDCGLKVLGSGKIRIVERIIMSPKNAKRFMRDLERRV